MRIVIPAPAGRWIPAFAGMTENENLPKMGIIIPVGVVEFPLAEERTTPAPDGATPHLLKEGNKQPAAARFYSPPWIRWGGAERRGGSMQ